MNLPPAVRVGWATAYSDALWKALVEKQSALAPDAGEPEDVVLGPVLPDGGDPRVAHLQVHRQQDPPELIWMLIVVPAPAVDAPPSERERQAGGRQGRIDGPHS